jgi:hypothetical protein
MNTCADIAVHLHWFLILVFDVVIAQLHALAPLPLGKALPVPVITHYRKIDRALRRSLSPSVCCRIQFYLQLLVEFITVRDLIDSGGYLETLSQTESNDVDDES